MTEVSRATALGLTLVFLALVGAVGAIQVARGPSPIDAARRLGVELAAAPRSAGTEGWIAANRGAQAAIDRFETGLEDESLLRERLLPPVQLLLAERLGLGNEQAYLGRGPWLFYRPDVDHVVGPGFLEPDVLERRRRSGQAWEPPPVPDPRPAILALRSELAEKGIELLVMPTPVKPMLEPAALIWRPTPSPPLRNPSWATFAADLERGGVAVLDVAAWIVGERDAGASPFLTTDTHWTPGAMEAVARRLAAELRRRLGDAESSLGLGQDAREVSGRGDIAVMLNLPEEQTLYPPRRVTIRPVTRSGGEPWRPQAGAEVLLLGDSFTNVFSEPALGWGSGAGLAEQLAFHLERPVDRIALNAGGSEAARAALAEALRADPDRLAGTRVVVYQFAERELSSGDWPILELP